MQQHTISDVYIACSSGNPYEAWIQALAANGCYRPIDPDKARKVEDKCVQEQAFTWVKEASSDRYFSGQEQAPFTQWTKNISAHLKASQHLWNKNSLEKGGPFCQRASYFKFKYTSQVFWSTLLEM